MYPLDYYFFIPRILCLSFFSNSLSQKQCMQIKRRSSGHCFTPSGFIRQKLGTSSGPKAAVINLFEVLSRLRTMGSSCLMSFVIMNVALFRSLVSPASNCNICKYFPSFVGFMAHKISRRSSSFRRLSLMGCVPFPIVSQLAQQVNARSPFQWKESSHI